jgi:hypothetical protein
MSNSYAERGGSAAASTLARLANLSPSTSLLGPPAVGAGAALLRKTSTSSLNPGRLTASGMPSRAGGIRLVSFGEFRHRRQ